MAQQLAVVMALLTAGCASFHPDAGAKASFLQRGVTGADDQFRVTVAVPGVKEASRVFDRRLDLKGIQPVWLEVENRGDSTGCFRPNPADKNRLSPLEVARRYHSAWRPKRNAALDLFFQTNTIPERIPPGSRQSGFVFTHLDLGRKQVSVSLFAAPGAGDEHRFTFVVDVPGLKADWQPERWKSLTNGMRMIECDEERLRSELEALPRATTDKRGRKEGDPLNLVLIGDLDDLASMAGCGWDETERMTSGSEWRTFKSFLFGTEYRYSPISLLYHGGRHQDLALQKIHRSANHRNHLRLWLTPLRYQGKPVWVGQISRDIRVRWTVKTANLTTHKINPNVDEARASLVCDLVQGERVKWWAYVKGAQEAPQHAPRHNLTGDPYYTDGLRLVLEISAERVGPLGAHFKHWEEAPYESATREVEPEG